MKPKEPDHFSFIKWTIEDNVFYPSDTYIYDFSDKPYNTVEIINAYAWWQSSVTLNLFDGDILLKSIEDFEKVSISKKTCPS